MLLAEVGRVLDALAQARIRHWVAGGWGVDALAGRQTREHRDLDVAVDGARFADALECLRTLGYAVETDWFPVRVEVAGAGGWVDVHPLAIGADGSAVQAGPEGTTFVYPADGFTTSALDGRTIPCLTVAQQLVLHAGYEPRPQDLHDLRVLARL